MHSVKNSFVSPFKVIIIFIFIALVGYLLTPRFAIDLNPSSRLPKLSIRFQLLGATPELLESEATSTMESSLSQVSGLKNIYSVSGQQYGTIELSFDKNVNLDLKKFEISSIIRQLYPKLHPQISYPQIEQSSRDQESKKPLLIYKINSSFNAYEIKKRTEDIFNSAINRIKGVRDIGVYGAPGIQINIDFDHNKLEALGLEVDAIEEAIQKQFTSSYPGVITFSAGQKVMAKVENQFDNLEKLKRISISQGDNTVSLEDVARISIEESEPLTYQRVNGLNSVSLAIYADESANRLKLAKNLKDRIQELKSRVPSGFEINVDYDDTEFLVRELHKNFIRATLSLVVLLVFIFINYRGWKHLLILFSGIVCNLGIALLVALLLKIEIHLYTIAGITVSLGLIIDNAIVVLDHLGAQKRTSYRAVIGATLTTIVALMLILLLPEEDRHNLTEFALILSINLFCSIVTSLFYVPATYALLFRDQISLKSKKVNRLQVIVFQYYNSVIGYLSKYRRLVIIILIFIFGTPIFLLPVEWEGHEWFNQSFGSPLYQKKIRPITDVLFGGTIRLFVNNVSENSGYREAVRTILSVHAKLPNGTTLDEMNRIMTSMESYLHDASGVEKYITTISSGQYASISITFKKEFENGTLPIELRNMLISKSLNMSGVEWDIFGVGLGFTNSIGGSAPNFKIELKGYNYHELEQQSILLASILKRNNRIQKINTNELINWNESVTEQYVLDLNRIRLSDYGLTPASIASNLMESAGSSLPTTVLTYKNQSIPVYIRPAKAQLFSTFDLLNRYQNLADIHFSLKQSGTLRKEIAPSTIHKQNRQYIRLLGFDYYGKYEYGQKFLKETLTDFKKQLPPGYTADNAGWFYSWEDEKTNYGLILILIVCIYLISAVLFESLKQPLYVIISIPISFIGLFISFWAFNVYFDQGGFAAFVLLGGLVVNSTIFILSDYNELNQKTNRGMLKVIYSKLRTITLTILSTCFGFAPFLIGGQNEVFWFALAVGTIGGILMSLLTISLIQPVLLFNKSLIR